MSWRLPGGRDQLHHHIYPIVPAPQPQQEQQQSGASRKTSYSPLGAGLGVAGVTRAAEPGVQMPLNPATFVAATGLVLSMDFHLSSGEGAANAVPTSCSDQP